jgi:methylthioribulose-1-phosphate dehydratase
VSPALDQEAFEAVADRLIAAGRFLFERGWVPATSGNFSARLPDGKLALTVSGRHKGRLTRDDILLADAHGNSLDKRTPSAETPLHVQLYQRVPTAGCVLHPHTVATTVLSRILPGGVTLRDYEVLKAFPAIDTHEASIHVPVFPNDQDTERLAHSVDDYMQQHPDLPAYIIREHGFYTWGCNVDDALRHVEALQFLLECELELRRISR